MRRRWAAGAAGFAVALASGAAPSSARADDLSEVGQELIRIEAEARRLSQGLQRPEELRETHSPSEGERRMVHARVAFGIGDYDRAALLLYDVVETHDDSPGRDTALYYLAESLYQKDDHVAARSYFTRIAEQRGAESPHYQRALRRLVELSLEIEGSESDAQRWLDALEDLPEDERRGAVPYVQGKHAYASEDYAAAVGHFRRVAQSSVHYVKAQYFIAASFVSAGQLPAAAEVLRELVERTPDNQDEARVIELAHMALARIHYERNEPSQAIDRYLEISRHSDRFDETLYEAAWVYVRNDQYDRALRALELLALTDPTSAKLPEVRILEGNLRIRKAQALSETGASGNGAEEYANAVESFETTKAAYEEAADAVDRALESEVDPLAYLGQVTGRPERSSESASRLPEVAVAWLRKEADVGALVEIETDLGAIRDEIEAAELASARVESALGPENKANVFPELADKRARATEAAERVVALRATLAAEEQALASDYGASAGELAELRSQRRAVQEQIAALPNAGASYRDRREQARGQFSEVEAEASEINAVLETAEAELTALVAYLDEQGLPDADPAEVGEVRERIAELEGVVAELRDELRGLRRRATLAKDRAGAERESRARELHVELRRLLDAEHRALRQLTASMSADDRAKAERIAGLHQKANSVLLELDDVTSSVDGVVDVIVNDVQAELDQEKARLAEYRGELEAYEDASRAIGRDAIESGLVAVREEFEDILVRADVGLVDVAWAKKEEADRTERRLTLDRARELRTLDAHFREVIEQEQERRAEQARREASRAAGGDG